MNKEEVIAKIIELKCDRDSLNDWIFEKLWGKLIIKIIIKIN